MTMAERVLTENIPHGQISIGFTPDEEVGRGADHFDVEKFDADFAYTMDGDTEGEIQYENFNAADAIFEIKGVNVHPGSAKDVMVNAALVAMEINAALPEGETPADTEDYEGFYHLVSMSGRCSLRKTALHCPRSRYRQVCRTSGNLKRNFQTDESEMGIGHRKTDH